MLSNGSLAIRAEKFKLFNHAAILCQDCSARITKLFKFRNFRLTWCLHRKKKFRTIFIVTATELKYILPCSVNVRSHKYPNCELRIWHLNTFFYSQACWLPLALCHSDTGLTGSVQHSQMSLGNIRKSWSKFRTKLLRRLNISINFVTCEIRQILLCDQYK